MQPLVLINGIRGTALCALDRGMHYGDGVFETIACVRGMPRFLQWHLERLTLGCERLRIQGPDPGVLAAEVRQIAEELGRAMIKLIVTRGVARARGYAVTGEEIPTRLVIGYPWPQEEDYAAREGVAVRTLEQRLSENPLLAGIKHCNRLEQVLAQAQLRASPQAAMHAEEGILFSTSDRLVSGIQSNVFLVQGSSLLTPRIDSCGVAGIMRRVVLWEAGAAGVEVRELALGAADLRDADELFLTNTRIGIRPVRMLDGREIGPGPLTRRLQRILAPLLEPAGPGGGSG